MLSGRLGLQTSRIPHADRHGILHLSRGNLTVANGTLQFSQAAGLESYMPAGDYEIPVQGLSMVLLGPGTTISHDALRILSSNDTALCAVGDDGVRLYTVPPLGPNRSDMARQQAYLWARKKTRMQVARRMYAMRLGELLPHQDIDVLRGIEGARVKTFYQMAADRHGFRWYGRRYDRANPGAADLPNQAINHVVTAVEAAAGIAVAVVGALPQLGFIHEDAGHSFVLDICDLYREKVTIPCAFMAAKEARDRRGEVERLSRKKAGEYLRQQKIIPDMIDKIKLLLDPVDPGSEEQG